MKAPQTRINPKTLRCAWAYIRIIIMELGQAEQINEYKILQLLGEGAFAKVYLAEGPLQKRFALKIISINQNNKDQIREQGINLASMKHNNILWARQFFYYNKETSFVIVTEYCNDGSLANKIGRLQQPEIDKIMTGIADGLSFLHIQKNMVHRDIKPQNILLREGTPKIADLGISKVLQGPYTSSTIGTPFYMAPEMFQGEYNTEVDIWALGIIYLELLAGKRIWNLIKGEQIPCKRDSFPQPELLDLIPSQKYRMLVQRMLIRNPFERARIQQVCSYFEAGVSMKFSRSRNSTNIAYQAVSDVYLKFNEFIHCRYTRKFFKQLIEKYMIQIEGEAKRGSKKAQFLLGKMYQQGYGMHISIETARQWYLKAYLQQQAHSCYELHMLTSSKSQKKQYIYYGKQLGEVRCELAHAWYYFQGVHGFPQDALQALDIAEDLCDRKYPKAYLLKGKLHSADHNESETINSYRTGADLHDTECHIALFLQYYKIKRYTEAIAEASLLQKNQQLTIQEMTTVLETRAKCHVKLKQEAKAIEYYKKCISLDSGNIDKDFRGKLGELYQQWGDEDKAIEIYHQAIYTLTPNFQKSQLCNKRLQQLCEKLYILLTERNRYSEAYIIADLSASLGFQSGKADKGYMVYCGLGVKKDKEGGLAYLEKLAKNGNEQALEYLTDIAQVFTEK